MNECQTIAVIYSLGGVVTLLGRTQKSSFLGSTRFNTTKSGGRFDVEKDMSILITRHVTHWAEIERPNNLKT